MEYKKGNVVFLSGTSLNGIIVDKLNNNIGIEFPHKIPAGHSCRGKGSPGCCVYMHKDKIAKVGKKYGNN